MAGEVGKAMDVVQAVQATGIDASVQQLILFVIIAALLLGAIAWIVIQIRKQNPNVERVEGLMATYQTDLYKGLSEQNEASIKRADAISTKYDTLRDEVGDLRGQLHDFAEMKQRVENMQNRLNEKDALITKLMDEAVADRASFQAERAKYLNIIQMQENSMAEMRRSLTELQERLSADEKGVFSCPFHGEPVPVASPS